MERPTRLLEWTNTGYQMENTAHWANGFVPSTSGTQISHDLFHHRYDESGQHWQEVRALGAMIHFYENTEGENAKFRFAPSFIITTLVNGLAKDIASGVFNNAELADEVDLPEDILKYYKWYFELAEADKLSVSKYRDQFLRLVTAGYKYANKVGHSVEKFDAIRVSDFSKLWNENKFRNIEVNLETAEIKLT